MTVSGISEHFAGYSEQITPGQFTAALRERYLDSIAEYADRLAKADRLADADTIAKAADINALYVEGSWVDEWQEVKPAKKDALGRVDAGSRSRFAAWLVWAEEQRGRSAPIPRTCHRLLTAHEVVALLPRGAMAPRHAPPAAPFLPHDRVDAREGLVSRRRRHLAVAGACRANPIRGAVRMIAYLRYLLRRADDALLDALLGPDAVERVAAEYRASHR